MNRDSTNVKRNKVVKALDFAREEIDCLLTWGDISAREREGLTRASNAIWIAIARSRGQYDLDNFEPESDDSGQYKPIPPGTAKGL